ncbi:extracellular solute-binding protein [Texas Phoenix palm phytoplasma]|uniref:extracellular solute-binding protein n=1 Tax=Texas Phoenix palm phytoplasma TaxID=176709 RepID=UPI001AEECADE|nr:extracellular solute-binding protein [Texas Phoenix palm phytoplasma]
MALKDNKRNIFIVILFFIITIFIVIFFNFLTISKTVNFVEKYNELEHYVSDNFNNKQKQKKYFENKNKKTKIVFWHNFSNKEHEILKKIIQKFEYEYPNIEVLDSEKGNWGQIYKNVSNALSVDKQPHLVCSYPDHIEFYSKSNKVIPLNIFMNNDQDYISSYKEQFFPFALNAINLKRTDYKGENFYYVPFLKSIDVLFYNSDIMKQVKSELHDDDELNSLIDEKGNISYNSGLTWDKMEKICQKMKNIKKDQDFVPLLVDSEANLFFSSNNGSSVVKYPSNRTEIEDYFKNEKNKNIMKHFKTNFFDKGYMVTSSLSGEKNSRDLFVEQKVGLFMTSTRRIDSIYSPNFNIEVTFIPKFNSEPHFKNLLQGSNVNLFYSKDQDEMLASWLFLKHLISEQTYNKIIEEKGGLIIVRKDVLKFFNEKKEEINSYIKKLKEDIHNNLNNKEKVNELGIELLKNKFLIDFALPVANSQDNIGFFTNPVFENSSFFRNVINELFLEILTLELKEYELSKRVDYLFHEAYRRMITN